MAGRIAYYGNIVTSGLVLNLDAAKRDSYPGSGTTWRDISGNGNNGTLTNGPTFNSDNYGSIVFDGVDDYVNCSKQNVFVNTSQFSISAWMKRSSPTSTVLIGQFESITNDVAFELWSDSRVYFEVGNGTNAFGYATNTSTSWQFVTMVFDGSLADNSTRLKGYIDNTQQVLTFNPASPVPTTTGTVNANLLLGRYSTIYSTGNIASVQIYNRALSASEVLQNYNATKTRYGL